MNPPTLQDPQDHAMPAWLNNLVIEGLQLLLVLRLQNAPAADAVVATATAWQLVLWHCGITWCEDTDTPRVRAAFRGLAKHADRWPAPAHLLRELPPRKLVAGLLAPPQGAPAEQAQQLATVKAFTQQLRQRMAIKPAHTSRPINLAATAPAAEQENAP